eukprot:194851-Amphidinium_carterae.1
MRTCAGSKPNQNKALHEKALAQPANPAPLVAESFVSGDKHACPSSTLLPNPRTPSFQPERR